MVRCRGERRKNLAQECVAVAALLACAFVLRPGTAFTSAPVVMHGTDVHTVAHIRAMPAARAVAPMAGGSRAAPWSSLGSVALLWAAAAAAVQAVQGRSSRSPRGGMKVVACQAAPQSQHLAAPTIAPVYVAPASAPISLTSAPSLLDTPVPEVKLAAAPQVFSISDDVPVVGEEEHFAPTAGSTRRPARFVGGQRRPRAKSADARGTSRAARAARRGVGAKLMPACEHHVIQPSFDASRARTLIQLGLRTDSRVHSERAHELKSPNANDAGSTAAKVLNISAFFLMLCNHSMGASSYHP
mmetsp:Transcript_42262/g.111770  ORF Transcript_42262/g.111770 Transcript_42262/m.111770 type:complete len:300 (-) Transcript_42262:232-1131(-)